MDSEKLGSAYGDLCNARLNPEKGLVTKWLK